MHGPTIHNNSANIAGLIMLFTSIGCVITAFVVYYRYAGATLQVSTTEPFIRFDTLRTLYQQTATVGQAVRLNATLLDAAWCNEATGDYRKFPETRAPACACINRVYTDFMQDTLRPVVGDQTMLPRLHRYMRTPWNTSDQTAVGLVRTFNTSTAALASSVAQRYAEETMACALHRSAWKIYPYFYPLHPVAMSFYTSYVLFLLAISYMTRVDSIPKTAQWGKILLFPLAALAILYLVYMNVAGNWFYVLALVFITVNFVTAINDEFMSMELSHMHPHPNHFRPPHPMMVGIWYYAQILFPVVVVHTAMMNLTRDIMALLGFYVLGYVVVFTMQRLFWTKWYIQSNMEIENYIYGYPSMRYRLTEHTSRTFRTRLMYCLGIIGCLVGALLTVAMVSNWYTQSFYISNWTAIAFIGMFAVFFGAELFTETNDAPFEIGQLIQVSLIVFANAAFVIMTSVDAMKE